MAKKVKNNSGGYKIKYSGTNATNFINMCGRNNITLGNVVRDGNALEFELTDKDYRVWKKLDTSFYPHEVIKTGGLQNLLYWGLWRIGLIVGLIIGLIGIMLLSNRLLQIHIYGLENISRSEVVDKLKDEGIGIFSAMNFDKKELEDKLSNEFDFSLVSIITKGNSLIISVKESLPSLENTYVPIVADYNMVITSISVYSGTQVAHVGDIVYKGDVLVEPYYKSGEDMVYVSPCADISASVYFNSSTIFETKEIVSKRTDKKMLAKIEVLLGDKTIFQDKKDISYANYETTDVCQDVTTMFLPITIMKTYAYELVEEEISRDFDSEKEGIISRTKEVAYNQVPESLEVLDEEINITPTTNGYIVSVYLTCNMDFRYQLHN